MSSEGSNLDLRNRTVPRSQGEGNSELSGDRCTSSVEVSGFVISSIDGQSFEGSSDTRVDHIGDMNMGDDSEQNSCKLASDKSSELGPDYVRETELNKSKSQYDTLEIVKVDGNLEVLKLQREIRDMAYSLTCARQELDNTERELDMSKADFAHCRHDLDNALSNIDKIKQVLFQKEGELDVAKQTILRYEREKACVDTELHTARHTITQYERENINMKSQLEKVTAELKVAQRELYNKRETDTHHSSQIYNTYTSKSLNAGAQPFIPTNEPAVAYEYHHGYEQARENLTQRSSNSSIPYNCSDSRTNRSSATVNVDEPKFRLPYYTGKTEFKSFWAVFQIGVKKFEWSNEKQVEQLMCCLKDDALKFAADLSDKVRNNIYFFYAALEKRFGDNLLPEQHRENLLQLRKAYKESLMEYATRVETLVRKAYPGFDGSDLITSLTIENMLRGLTDQSLAYEVKTKNPSSVDEAIKLIAWHECCKTGTKSFKRNSADVRQIEYGYDSESENDDATTRNEIRKVGSGGARYVTEERLEKRLTVMSKEIRDGQNEMYNKLISRLSPNKNGGARPNNIKEVTCYACKETGHISKYCPLNKEHRSQSDQNNGKRGQHDRRVDESKSSISKGDSKALN